MTPSAKKEDLSTKFNAERVLLFLGIMAALSVCKNPYGTRKEPVKHPSYTRNYWQYICRRADEIREMKIEDFRLKNEE